MFRGCFTDVSTPRGNAGVDGAFFTLAGIPSGERAEPLPPRFAAIFAETGG